MALKSIRPDAITGDDDYIETVFSIGDTTESWVQVSALAQYGVSATFRQTGTNEDIKANIDKGIPVPVGILHKGPPTPPRVVVTGSALLDTTTKGFIVHDPWVSLDHELGKYTSDEGFCSSIPYEMFDRRWTVDSTSDGWYIDIKLCLSPNHTYPR